MVDIGREQPKGLHLLAPAADRAMHDKTLIDTFIIIKFSSGEMSGKLSSKYKFELADDFNYIIAKKQSNEIE